MNRRIALIAALGLSLVGHGASAQVFWNIEPSYGGGYAQPYQQFQSFPPAFPSFQQPYQGYQVQPYGYGYVPPAVIYNRRLWGDHYDGGGRREWRGGGERHEWRGGGEHRGGSHRDR